jgi:hypothetical protein
LGNGFRLLQGGPDGQAKEIGEVEEGTDLAKITVLEERRKLDVQIRLLDATHTQQDE